MKWQNVGKRNPHLTSAPTTKIIPHPPTVEIDFADAQLTGIGGWSLLASMAHQSGLLDQLAEAVQVKKRQRGASDAQMLWALIASLAAGNGALSDLDALCADLVGQRLLGFEQAPSQPPIRRVPVVLR